jgi:gliding motility-associated-like protein
MKNGKLYATLCRHLSFRAGIMLVLLLLATVCSFAQPLNDNCSNAKEIVIGNSGFATGIFMSDTVNISAATMQPGETVPPSIFVAGQYQKSVWYKFKTGTNRKLKITLGQPGVSITAGDVGFSIYHTSSCLPGNTQISNKLTPLETFGSTYHPCVDSGEYLIQISSRQSANGSVFLKLEVDPVTTPYDDRTTAYNFGLLNQSKTAVIYDLECFSKESINETCIGTLPGQDQYTKTAWHTFTTPAYFDYITLLVAAGNTPYFTTATTQHIIGYKLYQGNAQTTPLASLTLVDGCDTLKTNGAKPAYRTYRCGQLDTNKTYSLQLFFKSDFNASIRVGLFKEGTAPSNGPLASSSWILAPNQLGTLPYGNTNRTDYFSCNTRHATNACGNTKTPAGIVKSGTRYNLSSYFTFTLPQASNVDIAANDPPGGTFCKKRYIRLFHSDVTNNCTSLDTVSLYAGYFKDTLFRCLPAGAYTVQVMGSEDSLTTLTKNDILSSPVSSCFYSNFGQQFDLAIQVTQVLEGNHYSLYQANAYDHINNMLPLQPINTYQATTDTFGCHDAALPVGFACDANYKKAMYREFVVTDSVSVSINNMKDVFFIGNQSYAYYYQFFRGDANAQVVAQNAWSSPATFTGLVPISNCLYNGNYAQVCLVPDTYTLATYGNRYFIGQTDKPSFTINNFTTLHYSQATVGNMGSVLDTINNSLSNTMSSDGDVFSCKNNAITIAGVAPCNGATKAIYREFYISQATTLQVTSTSTSMSIFSGKLSVVGFAGLSPFVTCFTALSQQNCQGQMFLPGWYTIVCYATGSSYDNPAPNGYLPTAWVGVQNKVYITKPVCAAPKFNRPYKAAVNAVTNQPFLVEWNTNPANPVYPVTSNVVVLPGENWNCNVDTPFSSHPIVPCSPSNNRVAYYVFKLTQECYLNFGYPPVGTSYKLYKKDVRVDSLSFATATPLYSCSVGFSSLLEICYAQPGVYTLVVFGSTPCYSFAPQIYVDKPDHSRFDHAAKAYDFGTVPATNTFYNGKVGDVNPFNPLRAPSNDFFYCSTGARPNDPATSNCYSIYNPAIYTAPDTNDVTTTNGITRRDLWYTFQLTKPGLVKVKVDNKTLNKMYQLPFAIYRSDVDGGIPFNQVVSGGMVDSTLSQGLSLVAYNGPYQYVTNLCEGTNMASFTVPACGFDTQRYYIVVDNRVVNSADEIMKPNHQLEVSVLVDSIAPAATHYDYYLTAANMNTLGLGNHVGPIDNYICATANSSYPIIMPSCAQKTLWYKFSVASGIVGTAKIKLKINNTTDIFGDNDFVLFREVVAQDSTATGLSQVHLAPIPNYQQGCVYTGTYYLVPTGCNKTNEEVYPEIFIEQNIGDFCNAPLVASVSGPGTASATALIDCHTIGTDYGEMGTTLTCPANGATADFKTSWFRIDVSGTDTLDLSISLAENTNASSTQIHYRMMTGDCNAMQEQSCVMDALTENTYQCMVPGYSYYLQVFVPNSYFNNSPLYPTAGTVTLNVSAIAHADTCAPMNNCLVNANFIPVFNCNTNDSVFFNNFSTFGSSIAYQWDFGYNAQTSTAVSPVVLYPALPVSASYTVTLRAVNLSCGDTSYSVQTITMPPRPLVNLGNDTAICANGASIVLHATSHPGSTYLWQDNSTDSLYTANLDGHHTYAVAVTYGSCTSHDSVHIYISPTEPKGIDTILICDGQTSVPLDVFQPYAGTTYLWNTGDITGNIFVSTPGVYWADVMLEGCTVRDSFVVQYNVDTLSVLGNDTAICHFAAGYSLDASATNSSIYQWSDLSTGAQLVIHSPATYWVKVWLNGCAYTDSVTITSLPLAESHVYDTACFNGFHVLPLGDTAFATGIYQDTLAVPNACDSVVTTHFYLRDSVYAVAYDTVCGNKFPFIWNGINVNAAGPNAATFISQGAYGCDSTTSLTLFAMPISNTVLNKQVCILSLPYNFLGTNISASGTYYDTLTSVYGCDSFIVLHLAVVNEFRDTITQQICGGNSYTFYDSVYTAPGFYTRSFVSTSSCDSFKILHLLFSPVTPPPLVVSPVGYCLNAPAQPLSATGTALLWYSSATGGTGSPVAPTPNTGSVGQQVYYVSQTLNNCESKRDTIIVIISPRPDADFTVVPDNIICSADSVLVTFTGSLPAGSVLVWNWDQGNANGTDPGPYKVNWNTGGNKTIVLWVNNAGCYSDTVFKSIQVKASPGTPLIELPDYVCVYDSITVYGSSDHPDAVFNWTYNGSPMSEGTSFNMGWTEPGKNYFSLYLTSDGCDSRLAMDSINVIDLPEAKIVGDSVRICEGDTFHLSAALFDANNAYRWSPRFYFPGEHADEGPEVTGKAAAQGWIYLNVTNAYDCVNKDSIYLSTKYCCDIYLPNAFSPNGDGLNDVFKIQTENNQEIIDFAVFNRYGQRIFLSHSLDQGWDGLQNGKVADMGTYYYYVKYICTNGNTYTKKGDVSLVR